MSVDEMSINEMSVDIIIVDKMTHNHNFKIYNIHLTYRLT
jgi:hypothetical protein